MKKINWQRMLVAGALAVLGGVATLGGVAEGVWAESANDSASKSAMTYITVSPMNQQIILQPGEVYEGSVKISNPADSAQPLKYSVHVGSFSQSADANSEDDYGVINTEKVSSYNQMMDWIKVDEDTGEVMPNETKEIGFTITVPEDAPAGGQYATLLFQNDTENDEQAGNVNIQSKFQVASIIYADVSGETHDEGEILQNTIPRFLTSGPLQATAMVENKGNVHTDAEFVLQVWPLGSDEEICTNEEDPGTSLVMPETKLYHTETCDLGPIGIYKAKQTVTIFGTTSEVETMVFLCPIWLIVIILVAIIAIIWFVVVKVRRKKGKFEKK